MPQWTQQQLNAINAKNRNILISAAAGSGKTAVLVERVIKIITNPDKPVDVDKLLIVTFTNAAAAEMKSRLSKSLNNLIRENPNEYYYKKQLSLLQTAKICTIDSFCSSVVKDNFFNLQISSDFSTLDESQLEVLENEVISSITDEYFEKDEARFVPLFRTLTSPGNEKPFCIYVRKLLRFMYAQPFPYKWLRDSVELYNPQVPLKDSIWYSFIENELKDRLDLCLQLVSENESLVDFGDEKINDKFFSLLNDDKAIFDEALRAVSDSWLDFSLAGIRKFSNQPSSSKLDKSITEKIKSNRNIYKKIYTNEIVPYFDINDEDYNAEAQALYPILNTLYDFVSDVDSRLMEEKSNLNSYSFSDIEHFAIKLLFYLDENQEVKKTKLAEELSNGFYEILVDEYQDTNEAQDLLFSYLSNGKNLFTVGDIKQSIYRFRLAMPHIFNERKNSYSEFDSAESQSSAKIFLDKNFRSRKDICSYVNFVFSRFMSEKVGEVDYNKKEYLNCGAQYPDTDSVSAQFKILCGVKGDDFDRAEAQYIADTIINKVNSKELVKDGDTMRPVRFGDFAVLLRKMKNHVDTYTEVLEENGINVISDNTENLFDTNEIRLLLSLIRVIDNPIQDIPLLAVMMSAVYGFSGDELADIRIKNPKGSFYSAVSNYNSEKTVDFINDLSDLRKISVTMSVSSFLRYLIEEKSIVVYINALGNGEQRYQNILKFISMAEKFDSGNSIDLTSFLRYVDKIESSDKGVEAANMRAIDDNSVTITSVHRSKGLEFPICIFAGTTKPYNKQELSDKMLLNSKYGLGLRYHDEDKLLQYNTVAYTVLKTKNAREMMSENLRVLYVAMTRAKEQFISFITVDSLEKRINKLIAYIGNQGVNSHLCSKVTSDGDFLLMAALMHPDGKKLRELVDTMSYVYSPDFPIDIEIKNYEGEVKAKEKIKLPPYDDEIIKQIANRLSYSYERSKLAELGSKLTASSLDKMDNGFEFLTASKPAFLCKKTLTPAQRGTALHTFMQFCSYENAGADLKKEVKRLTDSGYLSSEQAECLDLSDIEKFFKSSLADEIFAADKIYRELKMSSFVKACDVYNVDSRENVLVQGIADCVIEKDGELTLIDYKTDNVSTAEELLDKYKNQIMFYKYSVSKTLLKPVNKAVLYSFKLGKSCYYK